MTAEEYARKAITALANATPGEGIRVLTEAFEEYGKHAYAAALDEMHSELGG